MARQLLPRMELLVLKDLSATDPAQVPAAATIQLHRQGATVSATATIGPYWADYVVGVYDAGELATNDVVRVGTGPGTLIVAGVENATEVLLTNPTGTPVSLLPGTRLVPTANSPGAFADPYGYEPLGSTLVTDPATGRVAFYLSRDRVDYDVAIPGQPTRLFVDAAGEFGRSDQHWNDARDFGGDLRAAVEALPATGGVVFLPRGETTLSAPLVIRKPNVTLIGEGASSVIRPASGMVNAFDLITVERPNFQIAEMIVDGGAQVSHSNPKSCIVVRGPAHSGQSVAGMTLRNVIVAGAPKYGLWLRDAGSFLAKGCFFSFNQGSGVRIEGVAGSTRDIQLESCESGPNENRGLEASAVTGLLLNACIFEGNRGGSGDNEGNGVEARDCDRLAFRSCYFENADTPARTAQFLLLDGCPGAIVEGAWFQGGPAAGGSKWPRRAVRFANSPGSRLGACGMQNMLEHEARFDATSPDCVEMGTRVLKVGVAIARIETVGQRIISLSRRSLGIPAHAAESSLPSGANVRQGSLAWSDTLLPGHSLHLRIHDGAIWRGLVYDQL